MKAAFLLLLDFLAFCWHLLTCPQDDDDDLLPP